MATALIVPLGIWVLKAFCYKAHIAFCQVGQSHKAREALYPATG